VTNLSCVVVGVKCVYVLTIPSTIHIFVILTLNKLGCQQCDIFFGRADLCFQVQAFSAKHRYISVCFSNASGYLVCHYSTSHVRARFTFMYNLLFLFAPHIHTFFLHNYTICLPNIWATLLACLWTLFVSNVEALTHYICLWFFERTVFSFLSIRVNHFRGGLTMRFDT